MIFIFLCLTTSFSMSTSRSIHVVNGIISLFFMTEYYSIVIHTIKDFSLVNEAEVDFFFLLFPCIFYDPMDVGYLISASSAFSKSSLYICISVHILLKPSLKDLEHNLASLWNECNCMVVSTCFAIASLWNWNENWPFLVLQPLLRRQWHPTPVLLPGKSHGWRSLVGCSPWGLEESDTTEWLHFHFSLYCIGEGNGNPPQCSCLENPRDGRAWWLLSMGSHRVGHDWSDLAAAATTEFSKFAGILRAALSQHHL